MINAIRIATLQSDQTDCSSLEEFDSGLHFFLRSFCPYTYSIYAAIRQGFSLSRMTTNN